jgi:hypothetical protein
MSKGSRVSFGSGRLWIKISWQGLMVFQWVQGLRFQTMVNHVRKNMRDFPREQSQSHKLSQKDFIEFEIREKRFSGC